MAACPICSAELPPARIASPDRGQGTPGRFEVAVCGSCGAGVTLPLVEVDALGAFYPSGYGPYVELEQPLLATISRLIRRWQAWLSWRRPPLAALRDRAPGRGLDVGAGRGDSSVMLAAHGWLMTAVEPSPDAAATIRRRGVDARVGVVETVELGAGAYDCALFMHSLEHTIAPLDDLRLVGAALRPGGLVLISVPNFGSWQRRLFGGAWFHLDLPRHRVHFTGPALERVLRLAGFEDVRLYRSASPIGLPASLQYAIAGRSPFSGLARRVAEGLYVLTLPVALALDVVLGEADTLHAVARRPDAGTSSHE